MPGIAAVLNQDAPTPSMLKAMLRPMLMGANLRSGAVEFPALRAAAGWCCHAGSFSDSLPAWDAKHTTCLLFAGECFDEELNSPSAVLSQYLKYGSSFVERLNGWFSGLIFDLQAQKVLLFNDRFGLGRIYSSDHSGQCYLASEAKALLAVLGESRQLVPESLAEQFSCGCTLRNGSLFKDISLLPPASLWTFANGAIRKENYFRPATWESQPALEQEPFYEQLRDTFPAILPRYFKSAQKLAMSLTGGLDGRMLMAWRKGCASSFSCYSFGGPLRDCADVRLARRISRTCGLEHQTIRVGAPFFAEFPQLAERAVTVSDGTMDVSGAVELFVNRAAAQIAPVRLTGNYGSEILRGNVAFRPGYVDPSILNPDFARLLPRAAEVYAAERQESSRLSFIAFKQVPWHHYSRLSVEQSQLTVRSPYLDNDFVRLVYQAPAEVLASPALALRLISDGNPALARIPTDRGLRSPPLPVLSRIHHLCQEATVRAEYVYDYGMPAWLSRTEHAVPFLRFGRFFLGRHKFYHFRSWYRDQLSGFVRAVLLDPRSLARPYVSRRGVERIVREHTSGRGNHTLSIHKLLSAELVHRQLLEGF